MLMVVKKNKRKMSIQREMNRNQHAALRLNRRLILFLISFVRSEGLHVNQIFLGISLTNKKKSVAHNNNATDLFTIII